MQRRVNDLEVEIINALEVLLTHPLPRESSPGSSLPQSKSRHLVFILGFSCTYIVPLDVSSSIAPIKDILLSSCLYA